MSSAGSETAVSARSATVIAFVGIFQILAELGMSQYVMRELARYHTKTTSLFWNLVCLRLILALAGVVIITLAAVYVGYSQLVVLAIFLYTWTFALSALESPLETVLVANERFDYVTALSIIGQLGFAILGAIVLYSGQGFVVLVAVGLVAMMPQLALAVGAVKRRGLLAFKPAIDIRVWPHLMKSGLPFGFISLALTIAFSIDTVILSVYSAPKRRRLVQCCLWVDQISSVLF